MTSHNLQDMTVACPCCGDNMTADMVVCWECFRLTDKLTPGTYPNNPDRFGSSVFVVTADDIAAWDRERIRRIL